jgi:hypothetical protein
MGAGAAKRLFYLPGGLQRVLRTATPAQSFEHSPEQTASICSKAFLGAKAGRSNTRRLSDEKRGCRQIARGDSGLWTAIINFFNAAAPPLAMPSVSSIYLSAQFIGWKLRVKSVNERGASASPRAQQFQSQS